MTTINSSKLSIAIPTYESSQYVEEGIKRIMNFKCVDEVVIQDDKSSDESYRELEQIVNSYNNKLSIKLFRNEKNIGAFGNKLLNIKNCSNDIVYQIDSDNITDTNLDLIITQINNKNIIYLPSKIYQFRKYKNISKLFSVFWKKYKVTYSDSDFLYDLSVCKKGINEQEKVTVDKNINWVLNSGNFIVNRNIYLEVMEPIFINEFRPPLDAVAISYYWLKSEKKIKTLKDLKHFHRKRDDSVSFTENKGSYKSLQDYRQKILNL
jgi:glycosyltransferase involved in cell wall biosynthesis